MKRKTEDYGERSMPTPNPTTQCLLISVIAVTATVTLASVSSATKDAAADEGGMPDP